MMANNLFSKYKTRRFKWGELDCCLFSANIVEELYGIDFAEKFRNKYSTEEEAFILVKKLYNADNLKELATTILNIEPSKDFNNIKLYDLVLYKNCLGINYGSRSVFMHKEKGLIKIPNKICEYYWSLNNLCQG